MSKPEKLVVDAEAGVATYEAQQVVLSPREMMLLTMFVDDSERVRSRDEIVDKVWHGRLASPRAVDVVVFRLRSRLKRIGHPGVLTVFGHGYRLAV